MVRVLVVAAAIAACSKPPPAKPAAPPPPVKPVPPPVAVKPTFPNVPPGANGDALAWVLDVMVHRNGTVERADVEAHFDATFLAQVSADKVIAIFKQLAPQFADLAIAETKETDGKLVARATVGGDKVRIIIAVDPKSGKIAGLLFQPDAADAPKPASFDEAKQMMTALAPKTQLLVAELVKGACKPVYAVAATDELAIGSTTKLYVLLGLADRIIAGKATWDDELAVRDDWKSLPSGITQDDAPGTKLSIKTFAERMIPISDNTATDHLLYTVGRKQVEAELVAAKHAKPALDRPFLSTRELFLLKLAPADELASYLKLSEAKRRDYVDTKLAGKAPDLKAALDWKTARSIDKIEWFASSEDLCRVMAALHARAQQPKAAAVLDVLAKNPGLAIDRAAFPYAGFKGGSEPGVVNMTYLLRRADDRWFVVTAGFNTAEGGALDESKVFGVVTGVIETLGKQK